MKIYTRTGDHGETGLFGGERARKDEARIQALGTVDELNAALGLALALGMDEELTATLRTLQSRLFDLGADLGAPTVKQPRVTEEIVREVEDAIDRYEAELEPLRNFILPGGSPAAAALHVARSVCRRAERSVVTLADHDALPESALPFINRLSDLLFVLARAANHRAGVPEPLWSSR